MHDAIARDLLRWYAEHGRKHLPWRKTRNPYRILISELMLQQTQVERVIPYYKRWLKRFPTLGSLARASETDALTMWQGLGYYRRCRSLKKLADQLAASKQCELPLTRAELEALPGIGAYTASAILAFAHDQAEPALDTNLRRVLSRVFGCASENCEKHARAMMRSRSPHDINSALMDLGAMICRAREPECGICPLAQHCVALTKGVKGLSKPRRATSRASKASLAIGILREGKQVFAFGKQVPLIVSLNGADARSALKAYARHKLGIEIAVRPACARAKYNGENATLHRCSPLYGATEKLRAMDAKAFMKLPEQMQGILTLMRLKPAQT